MGECLLQAHGKKVRASCRNAQEAMGLRTQGAGVGEGAQTVGDHSAGSAGETSLDCLTFTGKCERQGWGRERLPQH